MPVKEPAMTATFTEHGFAHDVIESDKPVLVDFWASWCGPCRMVGPVVDKIANDLSATHVVGKVNVDEQPGLAEAYGVMSIPTLILFKGGKPVGRITGFRAEPQLKEFVISHTG